MIWISGRNSEADEDTLPQALQLAQVALDRGRCGVELVGSSPAQHQLHLLAGLGAE
jgi:hypothetical protein